jgi:predicted O-linked N-acetylglucosamine transferase (SPINDLY family)
MNLPELVTPSQQDYEARAVALAHDAAQLGALRQRLLAQRLGAPLFDTPGYTRQLEDAFVAMVQRSRIGLPPQDLFPRLGGQSGPPGSEK